MRVVLIISTLLVIFLAVSSEATPNTNLTQLLCNGATYTEGDPFSQSLSYVLDDLQARAPSSKTHDYHNISPFPNSFAYGHAACNANLTATDCKTCLGSATTSMLNACVSRIGARIVLYDCTIRYEQYPFTN